MSRSTLLTQDDLTRCLCRPKSSARSVSVLNRLAAPWQQSLHTMNSTSHPFQAVMNDLAHASRVRVDLAPDPFTSNLEVE